jgi:hypothetical protein
MKSVDEIKAEVQDLKIFYTNHGTAENDTVGPEQSEVLVKIKALEWVLGLKETL